MGITIRGARTFPCDPTCLPNRRVKWGGGKVIYAGAADANYIGVTSGMPIANSSIIAGAQIAVIPRNTEDGVGIEAADAISVGADVFAAANGMVSNAGTVPAGTNFAFGVVAGATADVLLP